MAKHAGSATASSASGSVGGPGSGASTGTAGGSAVASGAGGEQVAPFVSQVPGTPVSFPSFHGRPVSWVSVSVIMVAFVIGGYDTNSGATDNDKRKACSCCKAFALGY